MPTLVLSGNPHDGRRLSARFVQGHGWLRKDATADEIRAAIANALAPGMRRWSTVLIAALLVVAVVAVVIASYLLRPGG